VAAAVLVAVVLGGVHLADDAARLVWQAAPGRVALVSDAIAGAGLGDGRYRIGGVPVEVRDGIARREDGVLAGSTLTMSEAGRNPVALGAPLAGAVPAAGAVPRRSERGSSERRGSSSSTAGRTRPRSSRRTSGGCGSRRPTRAAAAKSSEPRSTRARRNRRAAGRSRSTATGCSRSGPERRPTR